MSQKLVDYDIERIMLMTDEEILAETIAAGEDPAEVAARGRAIFEKALAQVKAEAIGGPPTPNRPSVLRYINGRFERAELDDNGEIIEPLTPCPWCGVVLCAKHAAQIT